MSGSKPVITSDYIQVKINGKEYIAKTRPEVNGNKFKTEVEEDNASARMTFKETGVRGSSLTNFDIVLTGNVDKFEKEVREDNHGKNTVVVVMRNTDGWFKHKISNAVFTDDIMLKDGNVVTCNFYSPLKMQIERTKKPE